MRILIVEDHPDILANLYGFLEPKGHQLDSARNGYGGLALASEHDYDVIVLDIMLPGLNGLELCQKLRTELGKTTPVMMLTARDSLPDKVAGFDSGADDYLVKPFSARELVARVQANLDMAKLRRQAAEALRESEERHRLILESAKEYAIVTLDAEGRITSWNAGAERIMGYHETEVIGQPAAIFFTPEDRTVGAPDQELERARAEGRSGDER